MLDGFSGEETRVIPRILAMRAQWKKSEKEWRRLQEAGVDDHVINAAVSSFIVQVSNLFPLFPAIQYPRFRLSPDMALQLSGCATRIRSH